MESTEGEIAVTIKKEGSYTLPYDHITLHLPENEQRKLIVNGIEQERVNQTFQVKL
jgi:alpha-glucosidase